MGRLASPRALIAFAVLLCNALQANAQTFERVAPQAMSSTIVIDQNTDKKILKEQLLYALKNTNEKNFQAVYLIIEGAVTFVSKQNLTERWDEKENELQFAIDAISKITNLDKIDLRAKLKEEISKTRFGLDVAIKAGELLDEWSRKASSGDHSKSNKHILDKISSKLVPIIKLGLVSYDVIKKGTSVDSLSKNLLKTLPAIVGLDVEESARIRAISEIVFSLQQRIEDVSFEYDGTKLTLNENRQYLLDIDVADKTSHDLMMKFLEKLEKHLKLQLVEHLGFDDPAVVYFDVFYSKIKARAIQLKHLENESTLTLVLNFPLTQFAKDFKNLRDGNTTYGDYKTELGKEILASRPRVDPVDWVSLATRFAKDYFLNSFLQISGEFIGDRLSDALENPGKFAWMNNFAVGSSVGSDPVSELSTTLSYKIINRPSVIWEVSANTFFNKTVTDSTSDASKTGPGRRVILGTSVKKLLNEKVETALNLGVSSMFITDIDQLADANPDVYLGVSIARKFNKVVIRGFYEYEFQRRIPEEKPAIIKNIGAEFRFPDNFFLKGVYFTHRINTGTSFGITFPIVK